ncbi:alpha-amylase family glycosyl hydrolase [Thalassotalea sp. 1_MG-2023]|uniref:alpha-amylase family glycosyl hydrolase n=1 Tax=Thalassotalea sp. 1_MG-2023 TaxID=3062680 RepID=UPI0026E2F99D|nr:alpha-amylase family glycosyl hydrolase [Thalassotalea sp. 1_MG-2023]MDO6425860.1 alpha-amylase family glycosyl hydrolase [Thalassotalea sp. 1_MG-2023]
MKPYIIKFTCIVFVILSLLFTSSSHAKTSTTNNNAIDPFWNNAVIYFMMTDRFSNGDKSNDQAFKRKQDGAVLRNFMGGDIKGITQKIEDGYFSALGVNVLWMTPLIEQVHGYWDEDWGRSYPFHGYWPRDWTKVDPNFGTEAEMKTMIATAHAHGIRVLADVIINHTGPMTNVDSAWPAGWIRTEPVCQWHNYKNNVHCAVATSIPDIRTDSEKPVKLPSFLLEKWQLEGRQQQEIAELDAFFERTQLPRAPKYYIVKWLTDWVRDYGIDGFRVDTAKHVEADIWRVLKAEASLAYNQWKSKNSTVFEENKDFFMIGEVMHLGVNGFKNTPSGTRKYDYGDKQVDFYDYGFDSLINMGFATHANLPMETLFSIYSEELNHGAFKNVGILNYVVSHDDPEPYDKERATPYKTALKLMLAPGAAQIYYGDELARNLKINGTIGDATWRSFMNWQDLTKDETQKLLRHWQKLGTFRHNHLAVGAGVHEQHNEKPYIFSRKYIAKERSDNVLIGIDLNKGHKTLSAYQAFKDGTVLKDYYSDTLVTVKDNKIKLNTDFSIVLLGKVSDN